MTQNLYEPIPLPPTLAPTSPPDLLERLVALAQPGGSPARIVIDGPSGSGKTALSYKLAALLPQCELVHLEYLYGGWTTLALTGRLVAQSLLEPLSQGKVGRVRHWDISSGIPEGWREISPIKSLIVEGSGVLTRQSERLSTLRIWLELPDPQERRNRALARAGGDEYRTYWDVWAAQELAHREYERPLERADVVLQPAMSPTDPVYTLISSKTDL